MSDKVKTGAEMWDQRFSGETYAYGKQANVWLAEQLAEITPCENNRALFPGDGEGRNAVWAATLGWNAEVFDLSKVGGEKCKMLAEENSVSVEYQVKDLAEVELEEQSYDIVAFSWFHVPSAIRKQHFGKLLNCLKKGGHFICEGYHTSQMQLTSGGPKSLDLLWNLDEILEEWNPVDESGNSEFEIRHAAVASSVLEESALHTGLARVVRIHLVKQ